MAVALGRGAGPAVNPPLVLSSTYRGGGYGREGNEVWSAFEEVVGALEGGTAVVFPSGLAAVRAVLELVGADELVVAPTGAYSGTRQLLRDLSARGRLRCSFVDITDTAAVLAASAGASLLWVESPTNPLMGVADVAALASSSGTGVGAARCVVDNTFATPLLQRPLSMGADLVVHSATKLLSGHSDVILGVVVARDESLAAAVRDVRHDHGAVPSPFDVFLALRGIRTLPVRLERACATAAVLAERLGAHPSVSYVLYPGFGTMLSFVTGDDGTAAAADRFCASVRVAVAATSLGGVETLVERRARYPLDADAGVPEGLVRVSVGLEDVEDLWADFQGALQAT
jgi:cystathionine gamma-synthase